MSAVTLVERVNAFSEVAPTCHDGVFGKMTHGPEVKILKVGCPGGMFKLLAMNHAARAERVALSITPNPIGPDNSKTRADVMWKTWADV